MLLFKCRDHSRGAALRECSKTFLQELFYFSSFEIRFFLLALKSGYRQGCTVFQCKQKNGLSSVPYQWSFLHNYNYTVCNSQRCCAIQKVEFRAFSQFKKSELHMKSSTKQNVFHVFQLLTYSLKINVIWHKGTSTALQVDSQSLCTIRK